MYCTTKGVHHEAQYSGTSLLHTFNMQACQWSMARKECISRSIALGCWTLPPLSCYPGPDSVRAEPSQPTWQEPPPPPPQCAASGLLPACQTVARWPGFLATWRVQAVHHCSPQHCTPLLPPHATALSLGDARAQFSLDTMVHWWRHATPPTMKFGFNPASLEAPVDMPGGFGMTPWCDDLVCSWRRLLADRHSLPFPWTLSLHRRWCPSASHHPLTFLFLRALTFPLPSPFPSLGLSLRRPWCPSASPHSFPSLSLGGLCQRSPRTCPVSLLCVESTQRKANAFAVGQVRPSGHPKPAVRYLSSGHAWGQARALAQAASQNYP